MSSASIGLTNAAADSLHRSLDKKEAAKFAALADKWWDASTGPFAPLHALNAARCLFVRQGVCSLRGLEQSLGEPLQGLQVLDVGCGGGLLSEPVARMGAAVVGIDVSDEGVAAATAHAAADPLTAQRIRYHKTTLEELLSQPCEAGRYDIVMSSEVIEHVRRPQSFMADLAAAAAPGGQVFITTLNRTPAAFALAVVGAEYLMNLVPRGTHNWDKFITPQELAMMGKDAGLKLELLSGMVLDPLSEAETLQQRAERRGGAEALQAFQVAADKYREALEAGLDPQVAAEALFGLVTQPNLPAGTSQGVVLRPDAAVNAANALTSWAEVTQEPRQCLQLLQQAVQLYQAALQQEEDALTLSNLGDALVALGEAALNAGDAAAGQDAFQAAVQAYESSCSLTDSSAGDDLPGLLHNWGVGLHTISKHAQGLQLKQSLLQQAVEKLKASMQFGRADPDPANALGDVVMDAAEVAAGLVQQAANDGYMAALTISRTNADALVGLAEASVAMYRLAHGQGDDQAAAAHIQAAVSYYKSALQRPHLLGDHSDRCDVRYNAACAAALAGPCHHALVQQLLAFLAESGRFQAAEAAADEDLSCVRHQVWFMQLVAHSQQ
eukprot:gene10991-11145_t